VDEAAGHLQETVERTPENTEAWYNLGMARLRQARPHQASRCFRQVLQRQPDSANALTGLGLSLLGEGRQQEALATFQSALELDPRQAQAWHGLGIVHLVQGHLKEAIEAFNEALRCNPQLVKAHSDLGLALSRRGQWAQAVRSHVLAVRLHEQGGDFLETMTSPAASADVVADIVIFYCRLAFALHQHGDHQAAARAYRAALARDPDWPGKFLTKAWKLATCHEVHRRDPRLAYELASQVIQSAGEPSALMLHTLAAAQAAQGQFRQAVQTARQALKKASGSGNHGLARSIRDHLRFYEKGEPVPARGP
jgi:tetratricopeptide (TPR) repeat protein